MKSFVEYLMRLVREKFYGEIRIKFQNGKIVHVEEEKSIDVKQFEV